MTETGIPGRPGSCGSEFDGGPHALDWLADDFAYCPGCDLLYARQPGTLVWVYDPWAIRLATALAALRADAAAAAAGLSPADVAALIAGDGPDPEAA